MLLLLLPVPSRRWCVPPLLAIVGAALSAIRVDAFAPPLLRTYGVAAPTRLYISSYTSGSSNSATLSSTENRNPEENAVAYLSEPTAVEARATLTGTCVVSGVANDDQRSDQFLLDLLNHEDSAFEFTTLRTVVTNVAASKKRLLSRSARYTGLLDKLDLVEADTDTGLPTAAQLEGATSWVAYVDTNHLPTLETIATTAASVDSLRNVAVLLGQANQLEATQSQAAWTQLSQAADNHYNATVVVVGDLQDDVPEGAEYYQYEQFGTPEGVLPAETTFSRAEAYRMVTELLQLACGAQQALAFAPVYNPNATEAKLILGLRQAGYARPQEVDHMIRHGPAAYRDYIATWKEQNPDAAAGYTTDAWWEADVYQQSRRRSAAQQATAAQAAVDARTTEIEAIATEWAKREYFRQSMAGTVAEGTTQEDFIQQVWDRALLEGDRKYRQAAGQVVDGDAELATFQAKQERKKQTMLQRAKDELADMLEEDGLSTEELKQKWKEDEQDMEDAGKNDELPLASKPPPGPCGQ